jgi:hypothetical protein
VTEDDEDQQTVRALLENLAGIRARMRPDDVSQLDALTQLLGTRENNEIRPRVLARIRELLAANLVSDEDAPGARRFKYGAAVPPGTELEHTLELLLGSGGGVRAQPRPERAEPEPGPTEPTGPAEPTEPTTSAASADPFEAAVNRLLAAPSVDAAQLFGSFHHDPGQRNLVRLSRADGTVQLPSFQFDSAGRPLALVLTINEILDADRDPWGVADWWLGDHRWLPSPPAGCLGRIEDERLLEAARYAVEGEWS